MAILTFAGFRLEAQSAVIVKLEIVKKPAAPDGQAMATVKGPIKVKGKATVGEKTGHIATHARQAWIIMNGQGALLLLSPEKKGDQYQLRYLRIGCAGEPAVDGLSISGDNQRFSCRGVDSVQGKGPRSAGRLRFLHRCLGKGHVSQRASLALVQLVNMASQFAAAADSPSGRIRLSRSPRRLSRSSQVQLSR